MDNTVNETWIDKLVDELVDAKNEVASKAVDVEQLYTLVKLIFNNARLNYSGESLRIENEDAIFEYLKVIEPDTYYSKLKALKAERDAEPKIEASKAQEAKEA